MAAFVDLGIRGKVALVAAASKGMGRAAAFALGPWVTNKKGVPFRKTPPFNPAGSGR